MRSLRPLFLITACLCLTVVSSSCSSRAGSAAQTAPATASTPSPTPQPKRYYVVEFGDTLSIIAERFRVSESALVNLNSLRNANEIFVGQRLQLPPNAAKWTPAPEPIGTVQIPILLYHHIALLAEDAGLEWETTTVTPAAFEEQLAYLAYNGYHTVKISDILEAFAGRKTLPRKPVVIAFDDGWIDCWETAFPSLQRYDMIASFFIIADTVGGNHTMEWWQIEALDQAGMEIGSHSMSHPFLTQLDAETLAWEVQKSKAIIEQHVAEPVEVLAYPFGAYDANVVVQTATAGYRAALTIEDGLLDIGDNVYEMPRQTIPYGAGLATFAMMLGETP